MQLVNGVGGHLPGVVCRPFVGLVGGDCDKLRQSAAATFIADASVSSKFQVGGVHSNPVAKASGAGKSMCGRLCLVGLFCGDIDRTLASEVV
mmetsp:Transcript_110874/g.191765  ORF Transcript_110874/g.191765 Transcript_110874/m.191765 type:complete len:92 (+) Transcript_110874:453-728(+)